MYCEPGFDIVVNMPEQFAAQIESGNGKTAHAIRTSGATVD
jgi:hypothetical protein